MSPSKLLAGGAAAAAGSGRSLADAGAQVDVRMQLLTQSPLTLSFGWAYAFERGEAPTREWMASLKVL